MLMWQRILVPTDFSPSSQRALEQAIALAHLTDAVIEVVHVLAPTPAVAASEGLAILTRGETRDDAEEQLDNWLDGIPGGELLARRVLDGEPSREIVAFADRERFDAIVMGTHGRTGLARALIGSVAERVVRHASCPVLTVRAPAQEEREARAEPP